MKVAFRCGLPHGKFVKIACVKIHLKCPTINYRDRAAPVPENLSLQMSGGPGCFSCKVKAAIRCGLAHGEFVKIACVKIHLKCPTINYRDRAAPVPENLSLQMSGGPGCFSCKVKAAIRCGLAHGEFVKIACVKIHLKCPTGGFYQSVGAGFRPRPRKIYLCRFREDKAVSSAK